MLLAIVFFLPQISPKCYFAFYFLFQSQPPLLLCRLYMFFSPNHQGATFNFSNNFCLFKNVKCYFYIYIHLLAGSKMLFCFFFLSKIANAYFVNSKVCSIQNGKVLLCIFILFFCPQS